MLVGGDTSKVAWLTPHAAVGGRGNYGRVLGYWVMLDLDGSCRFRFSADGKEITPWLAPWSIYRRFSILFFDCWQQASFIQSF
jgi:hypothetical protein